jgi:hypothetical protein
MSPYMGDRPRNRIGYLFEEETRVRYAGISVLPQGLENTRLDRSQSPSDLPIMVRSEGSSHDQRQ